MADFDGILFSDLHLSPDTPNLNALFDAFVDRVSGTPEIACLGDMVEYWTDHRQAQTDHGRQLTANMRRLADGAKRAIWIAGNRDFTFDPTAERAGWTTQRDQYLGDFCGRRVALEHGDRFCTLDRKYQRFRWWFRRMPWRLMARLTPESTVHWFARSLRRRSLGETARKNPSKFGLQPEPVERLVSQGAEVIVCGHVHTPFTRQYSAGGKAGELHVMSDWRDDGAVVCTVKDGKFELMKFNGDTFEPFDAPSEQRVYGGSEFGVRGSVLNGAPVER
jgi:UDP-2,3-diacylglucosamine hydrolase